MVETSFWMGSNDFYPEERPVHEVAVDGFWIDEHTVTVAEFRRFVKATGYVTFAEHPLDAAQYPEADPDLLIPATPRRWLFSRCLTRLRMTGKRRTIGTSKIRM